MEKEGRGVDGVWRGRGHWQSLPWLCWGILKALSLEVFEQLLQRWALMNPGLALRDSDRLPPAYTCMCRCVEQSLHWRKLWTNMYVLKSITVYSKIYVCTSATITSPSFSTSLMTYRCTKMVLYVTFQIFPHPSHSALTSGWRHPGSLSTSPTCLMLSRQQNMNIQQAYTWTILFIPCLQINSVL